MYKRRETDRSVVSRSADSPWLKLIGRITAPLIAAMCAWILLSIVDIQKTSAGITANVASLDARLDVIESRLDK